MLVSTTTSHVVLLATLLYLLACGDAHEFSTLSYLKKVVNAVSRGTHPAPASVPSPTSNHTTPSSLPPVVFVPGIPHTRLRVTVSNSAPIPKSCPRGEFEINELFFTNDNRSFSAVPDIGECAIHILRLRTDPKGAYLGNVPGVTVSYDTTRPDSLLSLDTFSSDGASFIKVMQRWGYTPMKNLFVSGYDWRHSPHTALMHTDLRVEMKHLVETTVFKTNQKVHLVAHSEGGAYALAFLQTMSAKWKAKHIASLVSVGGMFTGRPTMFPWLTMLRDNASLPAAESYIPIATPLDLAFVSSLPSTAFFFPSPSPSPLGYQNQVIAKVDKQEITVGHLDSVLESLNMSSFAGSWRIEAASRKADRPEIPVHCIFSTGVSTPHRWDFASAVALTQHTASHVHSTSDGDGLLQTESNALCRKWQKEAPADQPVSMTSVRGVPHRQILSNEQVLHSLFDILNLKSTGANKTAGDVVSRTVKPPRVEHLVTKHTTKKHDTKPPAPPAPTPPQEGEENDQSSNSLRSVLETAETDRRATAHREELELKTLAQKKPPTPPPPPKPADSSQPTANTKPPTPPPPSDSVHSATTPPPAATHKKLISPTIDDTPTPPKEHDEFDFGNGGSAAKASPVSASVAPTAPTHHVTDPKELDKLSPAEKFKVFTIPAPLPQNVPDTSVRPVYDKPQEIESERKVELPNNKEMDEKDITIIKPGQPEAHIHMVTVHPRNETRLQVAKEEAQEELAAQRMMNLAQAFGPMIQAMENGGGGYGVPLARNGFHMPSKHTGVRKEELTSPFPFVGGKALAAAHKKSLVRPFPFVGGKEKAAQHKRSLVKPFPLIQRPERSADGQEGPTTTINEQPRGAIIGPMSRLDPMHLPQLLGPAAFRLGNPATLLQAIPVPL